LLFALVGPCTQAQEWPTSFLRYAWNDVAIWDPSWNEGDSSTTEVLQDELSIRLRNAKPQFLSLFFERRKIVRFAQQDDIAEYSRFVLPESLDEVFDARQLPLHQRATSPPTRWLNVRVDHFAARVLRSDGSTQELPVVARLARDGFRTLRNQEVPWSHVLQVEGIAPGDVVEFRWKYMLPYDYSWPATMGWRGLEWMDNWAMLTSWRVFFHGRLPVRKQRVELLYLTRHGLLLGGTAPDTRIIEGNEVLAVWENKALPGCIMEPLARPAWDLPHITVQLVPEDFRYWRIDRLSGIPFEQPYWLQVVRYRESRAFWWRRVSRKRVPDRQNQLIKDFIRREGGSEGSLLDRIVRVHDHISQHFDYVDDHLWYLDFDRGLPRIGDQVRDAVVRDISRYDLYSKLINTLRIDHSTAYVLDKRVGTLTDLYLTPLWDNEFLFGVRDGEGMLWMHPKRSRYGLLAGELPFYWQGTGALLIDLELLIDDLPPPPRFIDLPVEDPAGHVRGIEYTVDVDLSAGTATARAQVFLSGQFSTLGRASFLGFPMDSTVDARYGWRPTEVPRVRSSEWSPGDLTPVPPFRFRTETTLDLSALLHREEDGTWSFELAPLIAHVVPDATALDDRVLPLYWDFMQQDRFRFDLRFNTAVEVVDHDAIIGRVEGAGTILERRMYQRGMDRVLLTNELQVQQDRVDVHEMPALHKVIAEAVPDGLSIRIRPVPDRD